jgi:hypothetical protein
MIVPPIRGVSRHGDALALTPVIASFGQSGQEDMTLAILTRL